MNIYTLPGNSVYCPTHSGGTPDEIELVKELVEIGKRYTVDRTIVHPWHTDLYLVEFPGIRFNSVFFKNEWNQSKLDDEQHPDYRNHHKTSELTASKKIDRTNISQHLLEYQLNIVGKTLHDIASDDRWYRNITITQKQHDELAKYAIPVLQKIFKFNKTKAKDTFSWWDLQFGLKVKN
jgi:hypothetical protein